MNIFDGGKQMVTNHANTGGIRGRKRCDMIQQFSLPFAGPALATPLAGAAQSKGKTADTDFIGWMDMAAADIPEPTAEEALLLMTPIAGLVVQPPSTPPAPPQPETIEAAPAVLAEAAQALPSPEPDLQPPVAEGLSMAAGGLDDVAAAPPTRATLPAQAAASAPRAPTQELVSAEKSMIAPPEPAPAQTLTNPSPLAAAGEPPAPPKEALAAVNLGAKAKTRLESLTPNTAAAAVLPVPDEMIALAAAQTAASQSFVAQRPQTASARVSGPTPDWSRMASMTAVSAPQSDVAAGALTETLLPEPQLSADQAESPAIGALSQNSPGPTQVETSSRLAAAPPATALHSQLLSHAPSALQRQVEILLSPEELGHVRFQIRHSGDSVLIFLSAERPETMDMLRRNGDDLLREFRQAGFSGASLDFGQWGQQGQRQQHLAAAFGQPEDFSLTPQIARPAPQAPAPGQAQGLNLRL